MADDSNQRTYRPNDLRPTPAANSATGNDPLAELARLIGQSDPFAESSRDSVRRAAPAPEPASNWAPSVAPTYKSPPTAPDPRTSTANSYAANAARPEAPSAQAFGAPAYGQPRYSAASAASGGGLYGTAPEPSGDTDTSEQTEDYASDAYFQDGQVAEHEDIYDDEAPPRRRVGIIAVAAVFALAIAGTAGAFGYRALFGSSGTHMPPPLIKADTAPVKVVPSAASKDTQSNKLITDRVGSRQDEKIVPREEQPVDLKSSAALPIMPTQGAARSAPLAPANGSGIVSAEPKKIHTITIRPEQVGMADTGASAPTQVQPPVQASAPRTEMPAAPPPRPAAAPQRVVNPPVVAEANPEPEPLAPRVTAPREPQPAPVRHTASVNSAPLSLKPDAAPQRASAPPRTVTASAPAARVAPPASSSGAYAVQLSSQRSEAEAEAAFRGMQAKYPSQLGGRKPIIHRVDLGAKGIYFRTMVGPFATGSEASTLCSSLKSAGGQCFIQKN